MAALRIEIQKLSMELMEFKQVHVMQLDPVIGYFKNVFFNFKLTFLGFALDCSLPAILN